MRLFLDCIPCFQKQALFVTRNESEQVRARVLRKVMFFLYNCGWDLNSDEIVSEVYNLIRKETGVHDPYKNIKRESNIKMLKIYPALKQKLAKIGDKEKRLLASAKLAVAGNVIDFGPLPRFEPLETIEGAPDMELAVNDFGILRNRVLSSNSLLYFADNAGEIVLDRLFIEEMNRFRGRPFESVSFVVKGGPIINDATLEDALQAGITELPGVSFFKLGNGLKGTGPNRRDQEVKTWLRNHELIIAKGQGNFEGLSDSRGLFFLLMAKCPVIAGVLKVKEMSPVIKYS